MRLRERTTMRSRYGDDCVGEADLAGEAPGCPATGRSSRPARTSGTRASVTRAGAVACVGRVMGAGVNERPFRVIFGPPGGLGGALGVTARQGSDTRNLIDTDTEGRRSPDALRQVVLYRDQASDHHRETTASSRFTRSIAIRISLTWAFIGAVGG